MECGKLSNTSTSCKFSKLMEAVESGNRNPAALRKEFPAICASSQRFVDDLIRDNRPRRQPVSLKGPYFPWQQYIVGYLQGPISDREILCVVDVNGNAGKSTFVLHMCTSDELRLTMKLTMNKKDNMYHQIAKHDKAHGFPRTILVDCARAAAQHIQYEALEEIKSGFFESGKYGGYELEGDYPHLVMMMNEFPQWHKYTPDRWHIVEIDDRFGYDNPPHHQQGFRVWTSDEVKQEVASANALEEARKAQNHSH